jgi:hypothetical protein
MDAMSIDMDTTGNTSATIGPITSCHRIIENNVQDPGETGIDQITIDVTAQGCPLWKHEGMLIPPMMWGA